MTDIGRDLSGQALVASDQAASRLAPTGFDPSRSKGRYALADECELGEPSRVLDRKLYRWHHARLIDDCTYINFGSASEHILKFKLARVWLWTRVPRYTASVDEARKLLPRGTLWACGSMEEGPFARIVHPLSAPGRSNALSYTGNYLEAWSGWVACAVCAVAMRAQAAIAMEARQGGNREDGCHAKHDSADPQGIAQGQPR